METSYRAEDFFSASFISRHASRPDNLFIFVAIMSLSSSFVPPNQQRSLRACMVCAVVQTYQASYSVHHLEIS